MGTRGGGSQGSQGQNGGKKGGGGENVELTKDERFGGPGIEGGERRRGQKKETKALGYHRDNGSDKPSEVGINKNE